MSLFFVKMGMEKLPLIPFNLWRKLKSRRIKSTVCLFIKLIFCLEISFSKFFLYYKHKKNMKSITLSIFSFAFYLFFPIQSSEFSFSNHRAFHFVSLCVTQSKYIKHKWWLFIEFFTLFIIIIMLCLLAYRITR